MDECTVVPETSVSRGVKLGKTVDREAEANTNGFARLIRRQKVTQTLKVGSIFEIFFNGICVRLTHCTSLVKADLCGKCVSLFFACVISKC
jgi:hypothetical protein